LAKLSIGAKQGFNGGIELGDLGLELRQTFSTLHQHNGRQSSGLNLIGVTTVALAVLFLDAGFAFVDQHFELPFDRSQWAASHRLAFQAVKADELGIGPIVLGAPKIGDAKKLDLCG
jgi:hypothetical protein